MPFNKAIRIGVMLAALASLTACTPTCPTTGIGRAANDANDPLVGGSRRQLYQWAPNPRLDDLLRKTIQSKGILALSKEHGMQCMPRMALEECADCYRCTATFPAQVYEFVGYLATTVCGADGTMSVRADIGPGDSVRSMTFWSSVWNLPRGQGRE